MFPLALMLGVIWHCHSAVSFGSNDNVSDCLCYWLWLRGLFFSGAPQGSSSVLLACCKAVMWPFMTECLLLLWIFFFFQVAAGLRENGKRKTSCPISLFYWAPICRSTGSMKRKLAVFFCHCSTGVWIYILNLTLRSYNISHVWLFFPTQVSREISVPLSCWNHMPLIFVQDSKHQTQLKKNQMHVLETTVLCLKRK